jgi:hypothetical protein
LSGTRESILDVSIGLGDSFEGGLRLGSLKILDLQKKPAVSKVRMRTENSHFFVDAFP